MKKLTFLIVSLIGLYIPINACAWVSAGRDDTYRSITFELNSDSFHSLKKGDPLPQLTLNNVINSPDGQLNFSDCHGKLILIDFWATWCVPCVTMISKLDSLQNEFKDRLQIVGVSYQSREAVEAYFSRASVIGAKKPTFPDIVGDATLGRLFPHTYLPHFVWIDQHGKIAAITDAAAITHSNISRALAGDMPDLRQKSDEAEQHYDNHLPLFINGNAAISDKLIYHSLLSRYVPGLRGGSTEYHPDSTGCKLTLRNVPLFWIYRAAYEAGTTHFGKNRIEIDVKDPGRLDNRSVGAPYLDWLKAGNGYCYEIMVPPSLSDHVYEMMQRDLELLLPYHAAMEKRAKECWVLLKENSTHDWHSRGGEPASSYSLTGFQLHNVPLSNFIDQLNVIFMQNSPFPVIDETRISAPVDLSGEANLSDIPSLNQALAPFGLKFIKATREIPVLVITDKPKSTQPK